MRHSYYRLGTFFSLKKQHKQSGKDTKVKKGRSINNPAPRSVPSFFVYRLSIKPFGIIQSKSSVEWIDYNSDWRNYLLPGLADLGAAK